jgi:hypothetical protein
MMQLQDRPNVSSVLIHVAEVDKQDVAHSQTSFFDLARSGDAAVVFPGFRRNFPQHLHKGTRTASEEHQSRLDGVLIVSPTLCPFLLRQVEVPGNGELDAVSPGDSPQEYLPHQLAFDGVMHLLPDGPTLAFGQIQLGIAQPSNGNFQPLRELQVSFQESFVRIGHKFPNSCLAALLCFSINFPISIVTN